MKVLTLYTRNFCYTPSDKNLDWAPLVTNGASFEELVVAFIHVEADDESEALKSRDKKLVNHLKWVCRKNNTRNILLHSFAHLAATKADAQFTFDLLNNTQDRLVKSGYNVNQTPFGYFLNLSIEAPGYSMARVWAEL